MGVSHPPVTLRSARGRPRAPHGGTVLRAPPRLAVRRLGQRELETDHAAVAADLLAWLDGSGAAVRFPWPDRYVEIVEMVVENAAYSSYQQLLVCEEHGRRRGILAGWRTVHDGRTVGRIEWLAVDPAHRRRGIGRGLVAAFASDPRFERLTGHPEPSDPVSAAFWGAHGWWPAGTSDDLHLGPLLHRTGG